MLHYVVISNSGLGSDFIPGIIAVNGIGGEGIHGEVTAGYDYMLSPRFLLGGLVDFHAGDIKTSLDVGGGSTLPFELRELRVRRRSAGRLPAHPEYVGLRARWLFLAEVQAGHERRSFRPLFRLGSEPDTSSAAASKQPSTATGRSRPSIVTHVSAGPKTICLRILACRLEWSTSTRRGHTFQVAANYRFNAQNGGCCSF